MTPERQPAAVPETLLDRIEAFIDEYVYLGPTQRAAVALWVIHTWAFAAAHATPYLFITAPEKGSGKTRLLEILRLLVPRPWYVVRPSEAVLFRKVSADRPTLLFDEIDTVFGGRIEREDLRALLDAGHRPGATVPRCVGADFRVQDFEVYCPKALAGIGEALPDTVRDRSIRIAMQRAKPGELRRQRRGHELEKQAAPLRAEIEAWVRRHEAALRSARPELPVELGDRAADGWEPLLAIADEVDVIWSVRARDAARLISGRGDYDSETPGVQLLAALRLIFEAADSDRMSSRDILKKLARDEESPFAGWSDGSRPARGAQRRLARLLRRYGITSQTIRLPNGTTPKGYYRKDFEDAWARYVPVPPATATTPQTAGTGASSPAVVADVADNAAAGQAAAAGYYCICVPPGAASVCDRCGLAVKAPA